MEPPSLVYVKVQLLDEGSIAMIKYNRPQSGNSLHPRLVAEMVSALQWADAQPKIQIIIQTGEGRFFCTGMDLPDSDQPQVQVQDQDPQGPTEEEVSMAFSPGSAFYTLNRTLILSEKILIAAVNGPAVGYGVSSLGLYDLVYAVSDAYFFTPFVKWGMGAEGASSYTFPRLMGHQKAAALFLAGDRFSAEEAERAGLVSRILPTEGFLENVVGIARGMARMPRGAMMATRRLMRDPVRLQLLEASDRECALLQNERYGSEEHREAVLQFRVEQERKRKLKGKL